MSLDILLHHIVRAQHGFLLPGDLESLARRDRLRLVLIRWHEGRALAPAQDAARLIEATTAGAWTLRDVSLPADDAAVMRWAPIPGRLP